MTGYKNQTFKGVTTMKVYMNNGGQGAGWPSTTGNPSGGDRDNNPPKGK